jgi:hypothetical protein
MLTHGVPAHHEWSIFPSDYHEPLLRNQESAGAVIQTMWNVNGDRPHTVNIDYVTLLARRTGAP